MFLERQFQKIVSVLPDLSEKMRLRLADRAWIVALVFVIVMVVVIILWVSIALSLRYALQNQLEEYTRMRASTSITIGVFHAVFTLITIALAAISVPALKNMRRRGWQLVYAAAVLELFNLIVIPLVIFLALFFIPATRTLSPTPDTQQFFLSTNMLIPLITLYGLFQVKNKFSR